MFESQLRVSKDQGGNGVEPDDEAVAWNTFETLAEAEEHNKESRRLFRDDIIIFLTLGREAEEGREFSLRVIEVDEASARGQGSIEDDEKGE